MKIEVATSASGQMAQSKATETKKLEQAVAEEISVECPENYNEMIDQNTINKEKAEEVETEESDQD